MRLSFERAVELLEPETAQVIESTLEKWAKTDSLGAILHRNIRTLERFLAEGAMQDLLLVAHNSRDIPYATALDLYQDACWKHSLCGGNIMCPSPTLLGRAVLKEDFVNSLLLQDPVMFKVKAHAVDFVERLIMGDTPNSEEERLRLSTFASWATWNHEDPTDLPFTFLATGDPDEVRANLGLWPQSRMIGESILLLTYSCDSTVGLFRPTVADAGLYAGFSPPIETAFDDHGWTLPWPSAGCDPRWNIAKRPEAVHPSTTVARLVAAPRELS